MRNSVYSFLYVTAPQVCDVHNKLHRVGHLCVCFGICVPDLRLQSTLQIRGSRILFVLRLAQSCAVFQKVILSTSLLYCNDITGTQLPRLGLK